MRFSTTATGLALVAIATASTQSDILEAKDELDITGIVAEKLANNPKSTLLPAGLPGAFEEAAEDLDRAVRFAKDYMKISTSCDSAAGEYNGLSKTVSGLTPDMVSLACDDRLTSKTVEEVSEAVKQLVKSINTLEPYFEEYCAAEQSFPSQTETITSNLQMIVDAFEQACDA